MYRSIEMLNVFDPLTVNGLKIRNRFIGSATMDSILASERRV
jgi:hypothetical protein